MNLRQMLILGLLALGGSVANAWELRDDSGQTVRFDAAPQRIVSLLPSLTETVCALGQCAKLVGVDRYSNFPQSVRALPQVGGGLDPQIEAIVALKPGLVHHRRRRRRPFQNRRVILYSVSSKSSPQERQHRELRPSET